MSEDQFRNHAGSAVPPQLKSPRLAANYDFLSNDDCAVLDDLDQKAAVVRDRVRSVALRLRSSLYLYGPGGGGKSYLVRDELERHDTPYILYNARMSGRALFDILRQFPTALHVLEDMERLLDDRDAQGILRAATGGEDGGKRIVTWSTASPVEPVEFRGGLIILSNRALADRPVLNAIATRLNPKEWRPTNRQLAALMRRIAGAGFSHALGTLTPGDCRQVAECLIELMEQEGRRSDLRLLFHAYLDRIQWQRGESVLHWRDLVASMVAQLPRNGAEAVTRAARKEWERELIAELCDESDDRREQIRKWTETTGKSDKAFYRRRRELAL